jgi:hypothetical protein
VYLAAGVATAAATAVPLAMTPASGLALPPVAAEPTRPYIVVARSRADARDLVGEVRWRVRRFYTAALPGFATFLTAPELASLRADPRGRAVEPDRRVRPVPVRGRARPRAGRAGGAGVTVYVVDSGVDTGRPAPGDQAWRASTTDRGRRATSGHRTGRDSFRERAWRDSFRDRTWRAFDATGGAGRDCTGHGTRAAARVHAAAPEARIASVRVLGCGGRGTLTDVLAGLDWIRRHARGPSVAALSFDGAGSPALGLAVRALVRSGVFVVGATGSAACRTAPGGAAYSALAPRLAGAAARRLERDPGANPAILTSHLNCTPARRAIRQNLPGASNLLMHNGGL